MSLHRLGIYKKICDWTATTAAANKPSTDNLPANDFDLLQQFYPALSFRDLEVPFVEAEVGANFPYNNMKEMLGAAMEGKLAVAGYDGKKITSIEADNIRSELASLKDSTMKKIDDIYADAMKYASNPFPDETAKVSTIRWFQFSTLLLYNLIYLLMAKMVMIRCTNIFISLLYTLFFKFLFVCMYAHPHNHTDSLQKFTYKACRLPGQSSRMVYFPC